MASGADERFRTSGAIKMSAEVDRKIGANSRHLLCTPETPPYFRGFLQRISVKCCYCILFIFYAFFYERYIFFLPFKSFVAVIAASVHQGQPKNANARGQKVLHPQINKSKGIVKIIDKKVIWSGRSQTIDLVKLNIEAGFCRCLDLALAAGLVTSWWYLSLGADTKITLYAKKKMFLRKFNDRTWNPIRYWGQWQNLS